MPIFNLASDHGRDDGMIRSFAGTKTVWMIFNQYEVASTVVQDNTSIVSYNVRLDRIIFSIKPIDIETYQLTPKCIKVEFCRQNR